MPRIDKSTLAIPTAPRAENQRYAKWLQSQPCVICGLTPCEAAHVRLRDFDQGARGGGTGRKPDDPWMLPLCPYHHREQHRIGERVFWRGNNPHAIAADHWGRYSE